MMSKFSEYKRLQDKLFDIRENHGGKESELEDNVLEAMDFVWSSMSSHERRQANIATEERLKCSK